MISVVVKKIMSVYKSRLCLFFVRKKKKKHIVDKRQGICCTYEQFTVGEREKDYAVPMIYRRRTCASLDCHKLPKKDFIRHIPEGDIAVNHRGCD